MASFFNYSGPSGKIQSPGREIEHRGIIGLQKPFEIDELLHTTRDLITCA